MAAVAPGFTATPTQEAGEAAAAASAGQTSDRVDAMDIAAAPGELLSQGAEARVSTCSFVGQPAVVKERFKKSYRLAVLDEKLTKSRLWNEARALARLRRAGIDTPAVYFVDDLHSRLYLERIDGETVKEFIRRGTASHEQLMDVAQRMGRMLARVHQEGIIHGDLTTSNIMLRNSSLQLVLLDLGLTFQSVLAEDRAVDLYVLERAFLSTHPQSEAMFSEVLNGYRHAWKGGPEILKRLEVVRMRGRKRVLLG